MVSIIDKLRPWQKTGTVMVYDVLVATFAFYFSYVVRLGELTPSFLSAQAFPIIMGITVLIQFTCFYFFGMYRGIWRYSSTPDLLRIIKATTIAVTFSFIAVFLFNRMEITPRSIFIIDWLLIIFLAGGGRFAYRMWRDRQHLQVLSKIGTPRVIIVGAGAAGEHLCRDIMRTTSLNMKIVAFIDDDPWKRKKLLHNIPVMGQVKDLPAVVEKTNASQIYIAIPSATGSQLRRIAKIYHDFIDAEIKFKTLPKMTDIINGKIEFSQLKNLSLEDLFGRKEISLDSQALSAMITDKKILVSGAGGSIGSELCLQLAAFKPKQLVLFEISEIALYNLEQLVRERFPETNFISILGDIRNRDRVDSIFTQYTPELVLHAAAYKHVPIMEDHPCEAIGTNINGTKVLAEVAAAHEIERFVMVSTDKAVNPTNFMGATKRVAEMVCLHTHQNNPKTKFMTVRFGNVMGSSGSVIPLFQRQIENGGPITVTHPEITRYFMSIPEAAQLILQAGAIGDGGEIFVLDMGSPIKIADLARQMIKLSGLTPDEDIEIKYTGLRPGEKLYEELLSNTETTLPTQHTMVRVAKSQPLIADFANELDKIATQKRHSTTGDDRLILKNSILKLVPEYVIDKNDPEATTNQEEQEDKNSNLQNLQ